MLSKNRFSVALLVLAITALACSLPGANGAPAQAPAAVKATAVDATKVALEIQATNNAPGTASGVDATKIALEIQATNNAPGPVDATKVALEVKATDAAAQLTQQAAAKQPDQPQQPPAATNNAPGVQPTADYKERMKNAKILVYEDAGNARLGEWVKATLDLMGLKYTHDGDAQGHFMSHLNSGTRWDLIIVAAESRNGVQGEFWDVITPKVTADKSALIVEMWYLSQIANGRIQSLTSKCGIQYQKTRKEVDSIYTLDSSNPVFSTPNNSFGLTNYVGYWKDKGGDYVRLTGGDAVLLAGGFPKEKSSYGMMTSCIDGRVIIQTFSTHDYHRETMQMLWENYITNTLINHFKALE